MSAKKLLYATNIKSPTFDVLRDLLKIRDLGIDEVLLLSIDPLEGLKKNLSGQGVNFRSFEKRALSSSGILRMIKQEEVSFLAVHLDKKTKKNIESFLVKKIVKASRIPVLVINQIERYPGTEVPGMLEHVVFATDWSPESESALRYLLGLKGIIRELEIVNVINDKLTVRDIRKLKERLSRTRKICLDQGIDAEIHIYAGITSEEILTAVRDYKATAIIMGIRYKSIFNKFFSKNTSCHVVEETPVPTLVIP